MTKSHTAEPEINRQNTGILHWSCFILGCGVLVPWCAQLSAADYFIETYPNHDVMRWMLVCYLPPSILATLLNSLVPPKKLGHGRVSLGFLMVSLALLIVPITDWLLIHGDNGTNTTFTFVLVYAAIVGASGGVTDSAFSGLAVQLPFEHYQAYMRGWGFSALSCVIIRIATKSGFGKTENSLRLSSCIFFAVSSLACWLCLLIHRFIIVPHPVWEENLGGDDEQPFLGNDLSPDDASESPRMQIGENRLIRTAKRIGIANLSMFLTLFVQTTIFPGILSDVKCKALGSWYEVLLVLLNALSTFLVRFLPGSWITKRKWLIMTLVLARCVLIPIAFLAVRYYANPFVIASLIFVLSVSEGYLILSSFGIGQEALKGTAEALIGGSLLSFFFMSGMCAGSFAAMTWMLLK